MNTLKILRSILLAVLGIVLIGLSTNHRNFGSTYSVTWDDNNSKEAYIRELHDKDMEILFVLGGIALIICAIPTDLKRKKED